MATAARRLNFIITIIIFIATGLARLVKAQQAFFSVTEAVSRLPELSLLQEQLKLHLQNSTAAARLQDPRFVGTVFAPINLGLQPILDASVQGDLADVLGDLQHLERFLSTAVVPEDALTLDQLQDGMKLAVLSGNMVRVTVKQTDKGPVYYVNSARLVAADIPAGKAIIHLVTPLVTSPEYDDVLDALTGFQMSSPRPTVLWQDLVASTIGTLPSDAGQTAGSMSMIASHTTAAETVLESGSMDTAPASDDDHAVVAYSFEEDFKHAEQAASSMATSTVASVPSIPDLTAGSPDVGLTRRDATSSVQVPMSCSTTWSGLLQFVFAAIVATCMM